MICILAVVKANYVLEKDGLVLLFAYHASAFHAVVDPDEEQEHDQHD